MCGGCAYLWIVRCGTEGNLKYNYVFIENIAVEITFLFKKKPHGMQLLLFLYWFFPVRVVIYTGNSG